MKLAHCSPLHKVSWAPVYFEPLPGSGERFTIAVCVIPEGREPECIPSLQPSTVNKVFPEDRSFLRDAVEMVRESLQAYVRETNSFQGWRPPFDGVELGTPASGKTRNTSEFLDAALHLTSALYRPELQAKTTSKPKKANWTSSVRSLLIERDERMKPLVDARICLANIDLPSVFSFLSHSYAANLVSFAGRLQETMREARAKAWSLDQLDQAPSILFRPECRELLAGIPNEGNQHESSKLQDCIDELRQEARRRNIQVLQFDQPEEAAEHILDRHYSTA